MTNPAQQPPILTSLPNNREAEEAVIGAVLISPEVLPEARLELPSGEAEFYIQRHRWIWAAFEALSEARQPIDLLTLSEQLDKGGLLSEAGGPAYLTSLVNQVPSSLNAAAYARIVHEHYFRRLMIEAANTVASHAYDNGKDIEEISAVSAKSLMDAISQSQRGRMVPMAEAARKADAISEENGKRDDLPGIHTPLVDLNRLMGGGAQKSDLNLIAGRPGQGKTTLLMQIALHGAKYNEGVKVNRNHVAVFSLEMPKEQLAMRLLAQLSGIDFQLIRAGRIPEKVNGEDGWDVYYRALDELSSLTIYIDDTPAVTPLYIQSCCELLAADGKLDMVCIDSLNLMKSGVNYGKDDWKEADRCATDLKELVARRFNVPVWAAHQMNRNAEKRSGKPVLSDLRDGGEQPSDGVIFIHNELADDEVTITASSLLMLKQRNGPTGDVPVFFNKPRGKFENAARI